MCALPLPFKRADPLSTPTVSILLPTFNRLEGGYLERAIESALNQTFKDFELIVVDDGSIDGTAQYLDSLATREERVRIIRLARNTGLPAFALAQAYARAQGNIFAWLFDDCELKPDHLETLVAALTANESAGMAYGKACAQLSSGSSFEIGSPLDIDAMSNGTNMIPNVCVAIRRSTIDNVGWYDHHILLKRLCDWDLWHRVAREHDVVFVDRILAIEHGVGLDQSLGRQLHTSRELVLRYSRLDRRAKLTPSSMRIEDAYQTPPGMEFSEEERTTFDLILLEHFMMTSDARHAQEVAERLLASAHFSEARTRFAIQNGRPPEPKDAQLLASLALAKRRIKLASSDLIQAEIGTRAALAAAEERMPLIEALNIQLRDFVQTLALRNDEINGLRESLAAVEQSRDQVVQQLEKSNESLLIFRDAADQRFTLLANAERRIRELESSLMALEVGRGNDSTEANPREAHEDSQ